MATRTLYTARRKAKSDEDERRRAIRKPRVCEAWVRSPTESEETMSEVRALDLSRHGVGFDSSAPLAEGCFYWMQIGFGEEKIAQEVRVISCRELEEQPGTYRVGAEFC